MSIYQKINTDSPQKHGNVVVGGPNLPIMGSTFAYNSGETSWTLRGGDDLVEHNISVGETETSFVIPDGTKKLEFQLRGSNDLRWGFTEGNPAGSISPYWTLKSNDAYYQEYPIGLYGKTIYFAADVNDVVEIRCQF